MATCNCVAIFIGDNMSNILSKKLNAYKVKYMGDWYIHIQGVHVIPNKEYFIHDRHIAKFLSQFPTDEKDNLIYEKIYLIGANK